MNDDMFFSIRKSLYDELFECEVEPYNLEEDNLRPVQIQFIQAMLKGNPRESSRVNLSMTQDSFQYLVRIVLPENMEIWYSKIDAGGDRLLENAKEFLDEFGITYPY